MTLGELPSFGWLNILRQRMGAELIDNFAPRPPAKIREPEEPIELEISIDDVQRHDDETLIIGDRRLVVYIRDISSASLNDEYDMPRFHVAYCRTLEWMRENKRWQRYVATNRDDGCFYINMFRNGDAPQGSIRSLSVCQNCLDRLCYNGFALELPRAQRQLMVNQFTLSEFFQRYPKGLIAVSPQHNVIDAPLNNYPRNWEAISDRYRRNKSFACERCALKPRERKFIQVHHRNGQKSDCSESNLECLCLGCHAEQPMHHHMKSSPDHREFMSHYGAEWLGRSGRSAG